jgi:GT2 family glycosyltransferase
MMRKETYLALGGFDERYEGYGFADNDMTRKAEVAGLDVVFLDDEELHLFHGKEIYWDGRRYEASEFQILSAINAIKYHKKWDLLWGNEMSRLVEQVLKRVDEFPEEWRNEFLSLTGNRYIAI